MIFGLLEPVWERLGSVLGHPGGLLGHLGCLLEVILGLYEPLGTLSPNMMRHLGQLRPIRRPSWPEKPTGYDAGLGRIWQVMAPVTAAGRLLGFNYERKL